MKKEFLYGITGLVVGILLTGLLVYKSAPGMMMKETESAYDFDTSVAKIEQAALDMGWRIPAIHDLQQTMEKNGKQVREVKVFELCHPDHAYKILSRDKERIVSSMMPCRISVYTKSDGKTYVSWMNTALMGNMMGGVIADVMGDSSRESEAIILSVK